MLLKGHLMGNIPWPVFYMALGLCLVLVATYGGPNLATAVSAIGLLVFGGSVASASGLRKTHEVIGLVAIGIALQVGFVWVFPDPVADEPVFYSQRWEMCDEELQRIVRAEEEAYKHAKAFLIEERLVDFGYLERASEHFDVVVGGDGNSHNINSASATCQEFFHFEARGETVIDIPSPATQ